jgi:phytoene desaturase
MADRFRKLPSSRFDVIVIGAGTGGLTCAALLARHGVKVLVVDQHYVAGGNATIFRRKGYQFDIGLHYIGDAAPGGTIPRILDAAGVSGVEFMELDADGFDTFRFPDFEFSVPRSLDEYRRRLVSRFPSEVSGIDRFLRYMREAWLLLPLGLDPFHVPLLLRTVPHARLALRHMFSTLDELLDTCTKDPKLRAVLAGQHGTYGQPPSRAAAFVHAVVAMHYHQGAFYPRGGGQAMSDALADAVEQQGGKILLYTSVSRIVIENGRARGIEIESKHLGRRFIEAPVVISNADTRKTLLDLVAPEHLPARYRARIQRFQMSPPIASLYVGLKRDLRAEGIRNSNYWIFPNYDFEELYSCALAGKLDVQAGAYISLASLKEPDNPKVAPRGISSVQIMSIAPSEAAAWGTNDEELWSGAYRHNPKYLAHKAHFAELMLNQAEKLFPGIRRDIVYREVATPLTHSRYTRSSGGTSYGLALIPSQILHRRPGAVTPVRGLYLCGANQRMMHGIYGAMLSACGAAAEVVGKRLLRELRAPSAALPAFAEAAPALPPAAQT